MAVGAPNQLNFGSGSKKIPVDDIKFWFRLQCSESQATKGHIFEYIDHSSRRKCVDSHSVKVVKYSKRRNLTEIFVALNNQNPN